MLKGINKEIMNFKTLLTTKFKKKVHGEKGCLVKLIRTMWCHGTQRKRAVVYQTKSVARKKTCSVNVRETMVFIRIEEIIGLVFYLRNSVEEEYL